MAVRFFVPFCKYNPHYKYNAHYTYSTYHKYAYSEIAAAAVIPTAAQSVKEPGEFTGTFCLLIFYLGNYSY